MCCRGKITGEKRDPDNLCIEELAELISASIADMNAFPGKPEKSNVLQETVVSQLQQISKPGPTGIYTYLSLVLVIVFLCVGLLIEKSN